MLEVLAYDTKPLSQEADNKGFTCVLKRGGWNFAVDFSLSPSGNVIWLVANLSNVPDPAKAPAKLVLGLLAANHQMNGTRFEHFAESKVICLAAPVQNAAEVSPARLRTELLSMCSAVEGTFELWKQE